MKVEIHDLETDKVVFYPSIYKAAFVLYQNPGVIGMLVEKYGGTDMQLKH